MASRLDLSGKNVLIVEDEESCYLYLEEVLKQAGANATHVRFGKDAIDCCKNGCKYQLVLMDIKLPDINGLEVTRALKQMHKNLPIIAQTACAMMEDEIRCMDAGCDAYLTKPLSRDMLYQTISLALSKS